MTEIRSYRRVFELERRIYRIDRLRLNPGGVPVRGIVYFLVLLSAVMLGGSLPLLGVAARAVPWYLRDLALPGASAALLSIIRIEGRPFHLAAGSLVRYRMAPRHLAGMRRCQPPGACWWPTDIVLLPDGSDGRLRRLRYTGPGAVLVAIEHARLAPGARRRRPPIPGRGRADVTLVGLPRRRLLSHPQVISLQPAARLLVRSGVGRAR